jgi:hypothetical protein
LGVATGIHPFALASAFRAVAEQVLRENQDPESEFYEDLCTATDPQALVDFNVLQYIWPVQFRDVRILLIDLDDERRFRLETGLTLIRAPDDLHTPGTRYKDIILTRYGNHFTILRPHPHGSAAFTDIPIDTILFAAEDNVIRINELPVGTRRRFDIDDVVRSLKRNFLHDLDDVSDCSRRAIEMYEYVLSTLDPERQTYMREAVHTIQMCRLSAEDKISLKTQLLAGQYDPALFARLTEEEQVFLIDELTGRNYGSIPERVPVREPDPSDMNTVYRTFSKGATAIFDELSPTLDSDRQRRLIDALRSINTSTLSKDNKMRLKEQLVRRQYDRTLLEQLDERGRAILLDELTLRGCGQLCRIDHRLDGYECYCCGHNAQNHTGYDRHTCPVGGRGSFIVSESHIYYHSPTNRTSSLPYREDPSASRALSRPETTPGPVPFSFLTLGCGERCYMNHEDHGNCLTCGYPYHSSHTGTYGHTCSGNRRASWAVPSSVQHVSSFSGQYYGGCGSL